MSEAAPFNPPNEETTLIVPGEPLHLEPIPFIDRVKDRNDLMDSLELSARRATLSRNEIAYQLKREKAGQAAGRLAVQNHIPPEGWVSDFNDTATDAPELPAYKRRAEGREAEESREDVLDDVHNLWGRLIQTTNPDVHVDIMRPADLTRRGYHKTKQVLGKAPSGKSFTIAEYVHGHHDENMLNDKLIITSRTSGWLLPRQLMTGEKLPDGSPEYVEDPAFPQLLGASHLVLGSDGKSSWFQGQVAHKYGNNLRVGVRTDLVGNGNVLDMYTVKALREVREGLELMYRFPLNPKQRERVRTDDELRAAQVPINPIKGDTEGGTVQRQSNLPRVNVNVPHLQRTGELPTLAEVPVPGPGTVQPKLRTRWESTPPVPPSGERNPANDPHYAEFFQTENLQDMHTEIQRRITDQVHAIKDARGVAKLPPDEFRQIAEQIQHDVTRERVGQDAPDDVVDAVIRARWRVVKPQQGRGGPGRPRSGGQGSQGPRQGGPRPPRDKR